MQSNLSLSNATRVRETRQHLAALISANYPKVRSLKVKKDGWYFTIRAKYEKRRINVRSRNCSRAVIKFFYELNEKVYLQPYQEA